MNETFLPLHHLFVVLWLAHLTHFAHIMVNLLYSLRHEILLFKIIDVLVYVWRMASALPPVEPMVVIPACMLSPKYVVIGERKTSNYTRMVNVIGDIERVPPYYCIACDVCEWLKRYLVSHWTGGKSRIVPDDIPLL